MRPVLLALTVFAALLGVVPHAMAVDQAPGRLSVSRSSATAGSVHDYVLTYEAPTKQRLRGTLRVTIPGKWTSAQRSNPTAPGYVKVTKGTCQAASLWKLEKFRGGTRRLVVTVDCGKGESFRITYNKATAPKSTGTYQWPSEGKFNSWAVFVPTATQPTVKVTPAAPSHLRFEQGPTQANSRTPFPITPTVTIRDRFGNLTRSGGDVTLSLTGPCAGIVSLDGETTRAAFSGTATFDGLAVNRACSATTLRAEATGLAGASWGPFAVSGSWETVATASSSLQGAAATEMTDGRIFVYGGYGTSGSAPSAALQIFDPATRSFTPARDAPTARGGATAVTLHDGRVLAIGGRPTSTVSPTSPFSPAVEAYDPATDRWDQLQDQTIGYSDGTYDQQASVLEDGRVLVVSNGSGSQPTLYDPDTDTWAPAEQLTHPFRYGFTLTQLKDGRVLVFGGTNPEGFISAPEIYNPVSGHWEQGAPALHTRSQHSATLMPDGRVLIAGGYSDEVGNNRMPWTEYYNPDQDTWTAGPSMRLARLGHAAVLRPDGSVLIAGGSPDQEWYFSSYRQRNELLLPSGGWTEQAPLHVERGYGTKLFSLADGSVIAISDGSPAVELFS